ncbi:MAG: phage terminase large subunit [Methylomonas sp.]|jgi:predicted phage terminase large subunit-like protein|uniref:phage terminase large subunit n=1 Tax=Methylomonas sp. TaxID=418 RepID=UPI0025F23FAF|nr:phage terminase large subunit [Methylomonas sp.]MCK9606233.1 phage terminase large subunit [Methylomonas sp.]
MAESIDIQEVKNWREFEKELALLGEQIRQQIEMECEAFATDPAASRERRERAWHDYGFFCKTYFPHYVPTPHFSAFHQFIFERFPQCIDSDVDAREVHQAPRGEAKSTYETQLGSLWCIVTGRKHMIGIIMNTEEQAAEMLESIKAELDTNPRLAMDFPDACGRGRVWQATTAITANNIKVRIGGTGKKIRGMKHGPHRPDLIFLDDLENDENVKDKSQRDKVQKYVLSAVLGLAGPSGGMDVFWVGTSLHYDAAINRVSRAPGWRRRIFRSILKWPDRMDLWDQWEALYTRSGDDDEKEQFEAEALAFYKKRKKAMDAGAVCSWPEVRPLYRLMCMRAINHDSFSQEQQNEAGNDENAPFKDITFWVDRLADWVFFGSIDPSLGKKGTVKGDPSAILVGGLNRKSMVLDVVEADIARRVPDLIISRAIDLQAEYNCLSWAVETVQFQAFLHSELIKRAALMGIAFPGIPVVPDTDKALRIISLQPHVNNALIRLHRSQSTLIEQLRFWPEADHDDGPDALEMLWQIAKQFGGEFEYTSAGGGRGKRRSTSRRSADYDEDWDDD